MRASHRYASLAGLKPGGSQRGPRVTQVRWQGVGKDDEGQVEKIWLSGSRELAGRGNMGLVLGVS